MNKTKVLFLCTRNSARSQMAEAFLKRYADDQFEVYSAGFEAGGIHPNTVKVLEEIGIDTQGQYSKAIKVFMGRMQFDYVINVCRRNEPNCPTIWADTRNFQRWVFDDPSNTSGSEETILTKFREVRDQIDQRVQLWIRETTE